MNLLMLCTDLDRTLLPNGGQPESSNARERFRAFIREHETVLVFVTGRHKELVESVIQTYQIPIPHYLIADVGASIYVRQDNEWQYWQTWGDLIGNDWMGYSYREIHKLFNGIQELRLQEFSKQGRFKLSYYIPLYTDKSKLLKKMHQILAQKNIKANLIWSIDEQRGIGLLDLLPARADKSKAIQFLANHLGIDISETLFAGDSGNDISVMSTMIPSVLVANASSEVKQQALNEARQQQRDNLLYLAQGNFFDMNGNYSAGILEGIAHFFPDTMSWFKEMK